MLCNAADRRCCSSCRKRKTPVSTGMVDWLLKQSFAASTDAITAWLICCSKRPWSESIHNSTCFPPLQFHGHVIRTYIKAFSKLEKETNLQKPRSSTSPIPGKHIPQNHRRLGRKTCGIISPKSHPLLGGSRFPQLKNQAEQPEQVSILIATHYHVLPALIRAVHHDHVTGLGW
jgi:hypothetical protein